MLHFIVEGEDVEMWGYIIRETENKNTQNKKK